MTCCNYQHADVVPQLVVPEDVESSASHHQSCTRAPSNSSAVAVVIVDHSNISLVSNKLNEDVSRPTLDEDMRNSEVNESHSNDITADQTQKHQEVSGKILDSSD